MNLIYSIYVWTLSQITIMFSVMIIQLTMNIWMYTQPSDVDNGRWSANKWIHIIHQNSIKEGWKFWCVNLTQTNDSVAWNVWQNGLDFRKTVQLTHNKHHAGVFGLILVPKYNVFIQNQDKNIHHDHHGGRFFLNPIVDSHPWYWCFTSHATIFQSYM